jgi:hypothetical protein
MGMGLVGTARRARSKRAVVLPGMLRPIRAATAAVRTAKGRPGS